jgi:hypothetical protein
MDSTVIVAGISTSAAVVAAGLAYRASTRAAKVNETANTLRWAEELREDAADARREAREARVEATAAGRQLRELRDQLDDLVSWAQWVVRTIHRPGMSMDRLRETVPRELPPLPPLENHR